MWKPDRKRLLGRLRRRWDVGFGGTDWVDLAQVRDKRRALVNVVMSLGVP